MSNTNIIQEFSSMLISKSSFHNGQMRWAAVNSDTDWDLYGERMSLELYKNMIAKIKANIPPPEEFAKFVTSDYWSGGMPYLSIAHYSDGNGKAVPGLVKELFVDGSQLKAKGILHNNPLGLRVWKSLKEDEVNYKSAPDAKRIRISIAFLDLAHKHGENGEVFSRKSITDKCPECKKGVGEKIYLDGYLVHLALTRVPVNPRTIMETEDMMPKKSSIATREEDALSVLGGDETLVEEVKSANLTTRSDILVEMSDAQEEPAETPIVEESTSETANEPIVEESPITLTKSQLAELIAPLVEEAMSKKKCNDQSMDDDEDDQVPAKSEIGDKAPVLEKSALEVSIDGLYNAVNGAIGKSISQDDKLREIQPALENVGQAIMDVVKRSVVNEPPQVPSLHNELMEAIQKLSINFENLQTEVSTLKALSSVQPSQPNQNRVPVPRSIPAEVTRSLVQPEAVKPGSVRDIARRSVGL